MTLTRRDFLLQSALYGGTLFVTLNVPRPHALAAAAASDKPVVLTPDQWKLVEAIAARIIPSDDEPGATEAGVVNFVDKALANEDKSAALGLQAPASPASTRSPRSAFRSRSRHSPAEQDECSLPSKAARPTAGRRAPSAPPTSSRPCVPHRLRISLRPGVRRQP